MGFGTCQDKLTLELAAFGPISFISVSGRVEAGAVSIRFRWLASPRLDGRSGNICEYSDRR